MSLKPPIRKSMLPDYVTLAADYVILAGILEIVVGYYIGINTLVGTGYLSFGLACISVITFLRIAHVEFVQKV